MGIINSKLAINNNPIFFYFDVELINFFYLFLNFLVLDLTHQIYTFFSEIFYFDYFLFLKSKYFFFNCNYNLKHK